MKKNEERVQFWKRISKLTCKLYDAENSASLHKLDLVADVNFFFDKSKHDSYIFYPNLT